MISFFKDFSKFVQIFKVYIGKKLYIIFFLSALSGFAESFGILMVMPLLANLGGSFIQTDAYAKISSVSNQILSLIGLENSVTGLLLLIGFFFIAKGILSFLVLGLNARLCSNLLRDLKWSLYSKYNLMSYQYYVYRSTGYFINAIGQVGALVSGVTHLNQLLINCIYAFIYIFMAFAVALEFGFLALVAGAILFLFFRSLNNKVRILSRLQADESASLDHLLIQALHSFKYMRSTDQSAKISSRIYVLLSSISSAKLKTDLATFFTQSIREPLSIVLIVIIMLIQLEIFNQPIAPIFVAILFFHRALGALLGVQSAWQDLLSGTGGIEFVHNEFMNQEIEQEKNGNLKVNDLLGGIEFQDVHFSYGRDSMAVLHGISFNIPPKTSIALVGGSGAGKSTMVDMLTLMLKPTQGQIKINGIDSNKIDLSSWRSQIGYVGQDTILFDDTLFNNISLWEKNSDIFCVVDRVRQAAKQAHLLDFIESLPDGFDTQIGDRGLKLSGGQRQRLSIARELFRSPKFLILDEATSSLDSESEKEVQNSIDELKGKISILMIAHRLSTIRNVDCIYVIDQGKVVERGSFYELKAKNNSRFSKLVSLQRL